jgi:PAS domain S-box-containing protein
MLEEPSAEEMVDELQAIMSQAWTRALGHSLEEMVGQPFLDFVHPDDRQKTIEAAAQMRVRDLAEFSNRYRHQDGSWVTLSWRATKWSGGLTFAIARVVD